jgi:hypothetical protein
MKINRIANKVEFLVEGDDECNALERALSAYLQDCKLACAKRVARPSKGHEQMKQDKPVIEKMLSGLSTTQK